MSYSRLIHVSYIIQFMAVVTFIFPSFTASPRMLRIPANSTGSIKITIRFLRSSYQMNQTVHIHIQRFILLHRQQVSSSFHYLIHIRIIKRIRGIELSFHQFPRYCKIIYTMSFLTFMKSKRHGNTTNGFNTRCPEIIRKVYIGKRYILVLIIRFIAIRRLTRGKNPGDE